MYITKAKPAAATETRVGITLPPSYRFVGKRPLRAISRSLLEECLVELPILDRARCHDSGIRRDSVLDLELPPRGAEAVAANPWQLSRPPRALAFISYRAVNSLQPRCNRERFAEAEQKEVIVD